MALTQNVFENITTNYCTMYRCHEIREELLQIAAIHNDFRESWVQTPTEHY